MGFRRGSRRLRNYRVVMYRRAVWILALPLDAEGVLALRNAGVMICLGTPDYMIRAVAAFLQYGVHAYRLPLVHCMEFNRISSFYRFLLPRHDTPCPNLVVSVSGKQSLAIRAPRQANAFRFPALLANLNILRLQLVDLTLLLQVKDDDAAGSSSAEPVAVW